MAQLNLASYDSINNAVGCSLIATDDGNFGSSFKINLKTSGAMTNAQFTPFYISNTGNVGIGTNSPYYTLDVFGTNNGIGRSKLNGGGHDADKVDAFQLVVMMVQQ